MIAVQAIRCSSFNFSYFVRVIDECKKLLVELESRNMALKFVKRSANKIAHYLTKYWSSQADLTWEIRNRFMYYVRISGEIKFFFRQKKMIM